MVVDGYDEDNLATVESVTYKDNYPSTFDLGITIRSESNKIYTYSIDNCFYPINKEGYEDFMSYLLLETTSKTLNGDINLSYLEASNEKINTSKRSSYYAISKGLDDSRYLSGFYKENNEYYIYQNRLINEGEDPFIKDCDQKIISGDTLYEFYRGVATMYSYGSFY